MFTLQWLFYSRNYTLHIWGPQSTHTHTHPHRRKYRYGPTATAAAPRAAPGASRRHMRWPGSRAARPSRATRAPHATRRNATAAAHSRTSRALCAHRLSHARAAHGFVPSLRNYPALLTCTFLACALPLYLLCAVLWCLLSCRALHQIFAWAVRSASVSFWSKRD